MAQTAAAVQAVLGTNATNARIISNTEALSDNTKQEWYVVGNADVSGRERWVVTTASDDAATQSAAILAGLRA